MKVFVAEELAAPLDDTAIDVEGDDGVRRLVFRPKEQTPEAQATGQARQPWEPAQPRSSPGSSSGTTASSSTSVLLSATSASWGETVANRSS